MIRVLKILLSLLVRNITTPYLDSRDVPKGFLVVRSICDEDCVEKQWKRGVSVCYHHLAGAVKVIDLAVLVAVFWMPRIGVNTLTNSQISWNQGLYAPLTV
jgi:hypothetical protein